MATTAVLGGLIALTARDEPFGRTGRKALKVWTFGALAGLILLIYSQTFIVRVEYPNGRRASEVIASSRLRSCPCGDATDAHCVSQTLSLDPVDLEKCWQGSRRRWNQFAWTFGYLLLVGGGQSFLGLLWGGRAPAAARTLFLSYSRLDRDFAERLAVDLQKSGIVVWWDPWEMEVGDSLRPKIEEAISGSAWFGIILSPDAVTSPWVQTELSLALKMESEGRLTILPILHRPCDLPPLLRDKVWADFTSSYQENLELLLRRLRAETAAARWRARLSP